MKILAVGGGSGGHVTPVVAVVRALKASDPDAHIRFWCDTKFHTQAASLFASFDATIPVEVIASGKLRRYYHLSVMRQLLWPKLVLLNLRDGFMVTLGFLQSLVKLLIWRPDVVFTKGGYVCLPVGAAARILRIPLVIHDSDAHPGLTNRVLARWARYIATGAPLRYYSYPSDRSQYVGIPIGDEFSPYTATQQEKAKTTWHVDVNRPLIVVTGGGLGAQRINDTVVSQLAELTRIGSVILVSGVSQYDELHSSIPDLGTAFQLHAFVSEGMSSLLGAADVVVTRAGATTVLELAALKKPIIIIPNGKLTGGHQLKNAAVYDEAHAAVIINEEDMIHQPELLVDAIRRIIGSPDTSKRMAESLHTFSRPNAAYDVAEMIRRAAKRV